MAGTLEIEDLNVDFIRGGVRMAAVRQVSLGVARGECLGVVGESGSGKTQVFMAAMGLLAAHAQATGRVRFAGSDLLGVPRSSLNRVRGSKLSMIFQDPMSSLTPHLRVGVQMSETLVHHAGMSWRKAEAASLAMLQRVQVSDPRRRLRQYPHELSGGLRQRVMIGMSLLCRPEIVIADEPTTALDAAVQAEVMELLGAMRREFHMGIVLISHDLGVVAGLADRIVVMYAGRIVECADAEDLFRAARHPYTDGLMRCAPRLSGPPLPRLPSLEGQPPSPGVAIPGCAFAPRCARAIERCRVERPLLRRAGRSGQVACHRPLPA